MAKSNDFQKRISFRGNLDILLREICDDYKIGNYLSHKVIKIGYEDFNVIVTTNKKKYFFKFFSDAKDIEVCKRYIAIIEKVLSCGANHPSIHTSPQGNLYIKKIDGAELRVAVFDYIDGNSFYDLKTHPTNEEVREITSQVAKINKMVYKPAFIYDE